MIFLNEHRGNRHPDRFPPTIARGVRLVRVRIARYFYDRVYSIADLVAGHINYYTPVEVSDAAQLVNRILIRLH